MDLGREQFQALRVPQVSRDLYVEALANEDPLWSELFGDALDMPGIAAVGASQVEYRMSLSRLDGAGFRNTNEDLAGTRRRIGTATDEDAELEFIRLAVRRSLCTAESVVDLTAQLGGIIDTIGTRGGLTAQEIIERAIETEVRFLMHANFFGAGRTGELAVVHAAAIVGATTLTIRRSATVAEDGNRGAFACGRGTHYTLNNMGTLARLGGNGYRILSVVVGAQGAHDTITFTPALDVAIPAGTGLYEGDARSNSAGKGLHSITEMIGDEADSLDFLSQSRITYTKLNATVDEPGAARRRLSLGNINARCAALMARRSWEPGEQLVCLVSPGVLGDILFGDASARDLVIPGIDSQVLQGLVQIRQEQGAKYGPELTTLWGMTGAVVAVPSAPGGKIAFLTSPHVRRCTAFFVPKSEFKRVTFIPPQWIRSGGDPNGRGLRIDRRLQSSQAYVAGLQVFVRDPGKTFRIGNLSDTEIEEAIGGGGR